MLFFTISASEFGRRHQKIHMTSRLRWISYLYSEQYSACILRQSISLYDTKISLSPAAAGHKTSVAAPSFTDASDEDPLFLASLWLTNLTKMSGWWPNGTMATDDGKMGPCLWDDDYIFTWDQGSEWRSNIRMGPRAPDEENIQNQFHLT